MLPFPTGKRVSNAWRKIWDKFKVTFIVDQYHWMGTFTEETLQDGTFSLCSNK